MLNVLLVEDDEVLRGAVAGYLRASGYQVSEVSTVAAACDAVRRCAADVVLADYRLPDGTALELVPRLLALDPELAIIVLTGYATIDTAVAAIKAGAEQFLTKPVEMPALVTLLERQVERRRLRRHAAARALQAAREPQPFLGESAAIRELAGLSRRVAAAGRSVLLVGETGVGKGVLAGWLHAHGDRASGPFVDLNCAGLPVEFVESELFGHERGAFTGAVTAKPGLLEAAHGGTLFLDEIGDMALPVQAKLLKVLEERRFRRLGQIQERRVDVRLIAASHQDLPERIAAGRFRADLYYRLAAVVLAIPPLRARREDIVPLARHLLPAIAAQAGHPELVLSAAAERALAGYDWPGNLRELRNVLERAALFAGGVEITPADLLLGPQTVGAAPPPLPTLELAALERLAIERAMELAGGRVAEAARRLGVHRATLYEKLARLGRRVSPNATTVVGDGDAG